MNSCNKKYLRLLIVVGVMLVFCSNAGAVSLRYKLAMSGYSETEIEDIVCGRKKRQQIDLEHKRGMLGFGNIRQYKGRMDFAGALRIDMDRGQVHVNRKLKYLEAKKMLSAARPYWKLIKDAASRHAVNLSLILAIIQAESGFNPNAISDKGAVGLMQLMPHTAGDLGVTDLFDLRQNIFAGTQYLSECLKAFDTVELALAAYNAGPARVAVQNKIPPFKETLDFVKSVLNYEKVYRHLMWAL